MVVYTCKRCGYSCKNKSYYRKHLLRKIPCEAMFEKISILELLEELSTFNIPNKKAMHDTADTLEIRSNTLKYAQNVTKNDEYAQNTLKYAQNTLKYAQNTLGKKKQIMCINCGKIFKEERYRVQHLHRGSCCDGELDKFTEDFSSNTPYNEKDVIIASQGALIQELRNQIDLLIREKGNTYTYTQNIILQPFGKENINHINGEYVKDLIHNSPINCIPRLLKAIHFHEEHRENQNIKIPNKKHSLAQIFNGTNWEYKDKKDTIDNMTTKAYGIINEHYDGDSSYMNHFKKQYEDDKEVSKKVIKETEVMILNNQLNENA